MPTPTPNPTPTPTSIGRAGGFIIGIYGLAPVVTHALTYDPPLGLIAALGFGALVLWTCSYAGGFVTPALWRAIQQRNG